MNGETGPTALWAFGVVVTLGLAGPLGYLIMTFISGNKHMHRHANSSAPLSVPKQHRSYEAVWRQGFRDSAILTSLSEPVVREKIANYSRDEFNAYYDGVSAGIAEDQQRTARYKARSQELLRLKSFDAEYRHALENEI